MIIIVGVKNVIMVMDMRDSVSVMMLDMVPDKPISVWLQM
jgi:hypothetical protein